MSFITLNEKTHSAPLRLALVSWCPTMDLVVMVSDSAEITMFRLNGERVWAAAGTSDRLMSDTPSSLAWRSDGKVLAVGHNSGDISYLDVNDGSIINRITISIKNPSHPASMLRWMQGQPRHGATTTPRIKHDVRTQLSPLPPLPISSTERMFTSAHSINTLIHDLEQNTELVRLLAVVSGQDSFSLWIGSFQLDLRSAESSDQDTVLSDHVATPDLYQHALLKSHDNNLSLLSYNLDLFVGDDTYTKDMINTFNDFHGVLAYLQESLEYSTEEYHLIWESRRVAFSVLEDTIGKEDSAYSFFALLMTGVPSEDLNKWLSEYATDRAIKRWEKTSQASLSNIYRVVTDSCLQACDRLIIMIMILRKISTNPTGKVVTNLNTSSIDVALKATELLIAQLNALRLAIADEMESFSAFCQWLLFAIARLPEDDEQPETPMPVETRKVVAHIREHLWASDVNGFFDNSAGVDIQQFLRLDLSYDTLEPFPRVTGPGTPSLKQTLGVLQEASKEVFSKPARLLESRWILSDSLTLSMAPQITAKARIVTEKGVSMLYVAWAEQEVDMSSQISSIYITKKLVKADVQSVEIYRLRIDLDGLTTFHVFDIEFIDDQELIILLQSTTEPRNSHLLAFKYRDMPYTSVALPSVEAINVHARDGVPQVPTKHRVLGAGIHPVALAINGRQGRRTGLYIQADRQRYTVFDLDDQAEGESDDEDDDDDGDDEEAIENVMDQK